MRSLVWLRNDLRIEDNPALSAACDQGEVLVLYVLEDESAGIRPLGGAARWWLHHSLSELAARLQDLGGELILRRGDAGKIIPALVEELSLDAVFWNRRYGGPERTLDAGLKASLSDSGLRAESFKANLLFEPWELKTGNGGPYKVFTPFWRACMEKLQPREPLAAPQQVVSISPVAGESLDDWALLPTNPDWSAGLAEEWQPGESGAQQRVADFLDRQAKDYASARDEPAVEATSRLSPHLRFGELSPLQLWHVVEKTRGLDPQDSAVFRSEVGWREFCWHLLYNNPDLATQNYREEFDRFNWLAPSPAELAAWQQGRTGYPLVDAGMRQLWQTGWMHNRVRMVVASFLVKNLLVDWRIGEQWFWDTLVDADAASNPANWQWVAGSGADAAPYFRIFNPVTQSKKFDAAGAYLRHFVPELAAFDERLIHEPWKASPVLGQDLDYPEPLVELAASRERALAAYQAMREALS
ncbi:cryptochrome/photolyase family protein [Psychromicrobium sp. YIM B11713]|uniref:cryptochrome/photolyase family protein n=1 Tax=Psychromicrobium sp. YIM B11713 TaxID=3145233 RepID=UPI00374ECA4A